METTLFDRDCYPVAYICDTDGDGQAIFLLSGHVTAYLDDERIFGLNGRHMGWYVNGYLYDISGLKVGTNRERCPCDTFAEPVKLSRNALIARNVRYPTCEKPPFRTSYADQTLEDFLRIGEIMD